MAENKGKTFASIIDHFFWNEDFTESIEDAGVLHFLHNLSDHSPIYCTVTKTHERKIDKEKPSKPEPPKANWKIASEEDKKEFVEEVYSNLERIEKVTSCNDVLCECERHRSMTDEYLVDILASFEKSCK